MSEKKECGHERLDLDGYCTACGEYMLPQPSGSESKPALSEEEQRRRNFAFGNAVLSNPSVTREMIDQAAEQIDKEKAAAPGMKVSPELAGQLKEVSAEVATWQPWQRSLDPEGSKAQSPEEADPIYSDHMHDFRAPGNDDQQQCDSDCRQNWHLCSICGKSRKEALPMKPQPPQWLIDGLREVQAKTKGYPDSSGMVWFGIHWPEIAAEIMAKYVPTLK